MRDIRGALAAVVEISLVSGKRGPSYAMLPQLFAAAAEKLSFKRREVCSVTNQALANAQHLSPCSLTFGRVANDFGQLTGMLEDYQKSLTLRHRLVRIDPTNAQWRYDEACILDQMGYEYCKAGLNHEAIAAYEVSAAIWRQLAKTDPLNRRLDLSISLGKLGEAKLAVADSVGAIDAYEESAVNWRRLLKREPENSLLRVNLARGLARIGNLKSKAGDNTGALTAYQEVVAIYRGLEEIDGSSPQRQWNLSLSLDRIGDVELALGNTNAAVSAYEESLALRRRVIEAEPSNSRWQNGLSSSLKKIVDLKRVTEGRAAKFAVQRELQDIDARHLLEENKTSRINAALHNLARSLSKTNALLRLQFERCRNEASAIFGSVLARAWSAQSWQRAAMTVRLVTKRLSRRYRSDPSTLLDKISAVAGAATQGSRRAAKKVKLAIRHQSRRYRHGASALADKIMARA
jgi:tetratricopeptide (TPR) repeat protein